METLKNINKKVKAKQKFRIIGGVSLITVGLTMMYKYFEQYGWDECQKFISRYYPEEYSAITKDVIEGLNNH